MATLIWYFNDLRTKDHEPLCDALETDEKVVAAYFFYQPALGKFGGRRHAFMLHCLEDLAKNLSGYKVELHCLAGENKDDSLATWKKFLQTQDITNIKYNEPIDEDYKKFLAFLSKNIEIPMECYHDQTLFLPSTFLNRSQEPYRVFTPFYYKACEEIAQNPHLIDIATIKRKQGRGENIPIKAPAWLSLTLYDQKLFKASQDEAHKKMQDFYKNGVENYEKDRDYFSKPGTSLLSIYFAQGVLSIRQAIHHLFLLHPKALHKNNKAHAFLRELIWREFYRYLWLSFPTLKQGKPFKPWGAKVEWQNSPAYLKAWQIGETGFPIIDAAMQHFNSTGFMHNRLRMVVASFLTKNLLIDWHEGESYFLQNLIDADIPNNNGGWQWASSVGCDAQPYFRIFNPQSQSSKFDQEALLIRKILPSLKKLDAKSIHAPYEKYSDQELLKMGYYPPIIDLAWSRKVALEKYKTAQTF
jgi:deoxyribodipyrimidine photo-lyase